jgi:hypothetical protein
MDWRLGEPARETTMANFTQLNLNTKQTQKDGKATEQNSRKQEGANHKKTAMIMGTVIIATLSGAVLLSTNGCSKGSTKTEIVAPAAVPQAQNSTVGGTTASVSNEKPAKTAKKKRPAVVTYKDKTNGISFQYPRNYALKTGDKAKSDWAGMGPVPMNFVQPGGVSLAAVEVPQGFFPETNFTSAIFNVSVNRGVSAQECEQFASPENGRPGPVPPAKVNIGGVEFNQAEEFAADESKRAEAKYYHVFEGGTCYEFALGLATDESGKDDGIKPVSHKAVFGKLEKILSTVKVEKETSPEVAVAPNHATEDGSH